MFSMIFSDQLLHILQTNSSDYVLQGAWNDNEIL